MYTTKAKEKRATEQDLCSLTVTDKCSIRSGIDTTYYKIVVEYSIPHQYYLVKVIRPLLKEIINKT